MTDPTTAPEHIVVVGAGAAGLAVVETLRRDGYAGRVTVIGNESRLPYDRPPLSKQFLAGAWDDDRLALRPQEAVDALEADWRLGVRATALDAGRRQVSLSDGTSVSYDALVVATGVRPRRLAGAEELRGAHVLRTADDAARLRHELGRKPHLVVAGGGFLGVETAASARELGCEVTLVSRRETPFSDVLGHEVAAMLADVHRERGVELEHGSVADLVSEDGAVSGVRLVDGRLIAADAALISIGSSVNVEWLDGSGVEIADGIVCDASGRAAANIWAAGDVAAWWHDGDAAYRRFEHRTNAAEHGMIVARSILGTVNPMARVPYVWSDQYDLKVQIYGLPHEADRVEIIDGSLADRKFTALYGQNGHVCAAVGVNLVRPLRALRRHVAAQTVWDDAVAEVAA